MDPITDFRFGALAVKNGFASETDVAFALDTQRDSAGDGMAPPLGEILREMGMLTSEKINALVVEQNLLRSGVVDAPIAEEKSEPPPAPPEAKPAEGGAFKRILSAVGAKARRLFRDWIGKTAKEKAAATEKRDELIAQIAAAALANHVSGTEADAARKAKEAFEAARQKTQTAAPGRAALAASAGEKVAATKLKMALVKLGRRLIEKGEIPPGQESVPAGIQALEAKIADLS